MSAENSTKGGIASTVALNVVGGVRNILRKRLKQMANAFEVTGKETISILLIVFFALVAMFFLGYYYAYNNAINNANEQILEVIDEYSSFTNMRKGFIPNSSIYIGGFQDGK